MRLRFKLLVLVAGVTLLAALGVATIALWRDVGQSQERLACEGSALAAAVASSAPRWMGPDGALPGAREALSPVLERALGTSALTRAWIVDRAGRVIACADRNGAACPEGAPSRFRPAQGPMEALVRLARPAPLEASAPVVRAGEMAGAVRVSYRAEEVVAEARRLAATAGAVAGAWIALGLALGALLVRRFTRPLVELVRAVEALPVDQHGVDLEVKVEPELAELVAAFNRTSARLRESRGQLDELIASLNERVARATREGLRAERLATLGAIAAGFAHEMGNSLNVISGFTSVVLRELPAGDAHRPDLESVRREASRAAALLERFLFFARARAARAEPQSIEPVLREAVEVIGPAAADAGVVTEVAIAPDLPPVRADAELLRQAFVNLCVNAVQAMQPGGGRLAVSARAEGGVAIEFRDTGPGIDPAQRERIFEPFFTTKPNGTGLGLTIVRQAAEAHHGSVEVEAAPGGGAIFRIRLPAAAGQEKAA